jgi:toxin ParE1/3/4
VARVRYSDCATRDLRDIADWITAEARLERAAEYLAQLRVTVADLEIFPESGSLRRSRFGVVRILTFERRIVVLYRLKRGQVTVVRVLYGGLQW